MIDVPSVRISDLGEVSANLSKAIDWQIGTRAIPTGCLGVLHNLGRQIAVIKNTAKPSIESAILFVYSGDHGLVRNGVSAFPKRATRENTINMAMGGGTISLFARISAVSVVYCDIGIDGEPIHINPPAGISFVDHRISEGTRDCLIEPAMTEKELENGIRAGYQLCRTKSCEYDVIALGDMGIGNSSIASLLTAMLLDIEVEFVTGRGSGLEDEKLARKKQILRTIADRWRGDANSTELILQRVGGHEISAMIGTIIAGAEMRKPILVDGFITAAACLAAYKLQPKIKHYLISTTESVEPGFRAIADALGFQPLLRLGLRLGEGTGAALAWPIVQAAARYMTEVRSFEELGWVINAH
jgi:nicotinate-nucleotide--dimethylbenzimidazole phosphoribosyltransferase